MSEQVKEPETQDQQPAEAQAPQQQNNHSFNPNEHLMDIKHGNTTHKYLPVQWRLVWFREKCPKGRIITEEIEVDLDRMCEADVWEWNSETRRSEKIRKSAPGYSRYRAIIEDGHGACATGTKTECAVIFPDYVEKSETGAVGRALAMLGYGTQFTDEEFAEGERLADAPVDRQNGRKAQARNNGNGGAARGREAHGGESDKKTPDVDPKGPPAPGQLSGIESQCQRLGIEKASLGEIATYGDAAEALKRLGNLYAESRRQKAAS